MFDPNRKKKTFLPHHQNTDGLQYSWSALSEDFCYHKQLIVKYFSQRQRKNYTNKGDFPLPIFGSMFINLNVKLVFGPVGMGWR